MNKYTFISEILNAVDVANFYNGYDNFDRTQEIKELYAILEEIEETKWVNCIPTIHQAFLRDVQEINEKFIKGGRF